MVHIFFEAGNLNYKIWVSVVYFHKCFTQNDFSNNLLAVLCHVFVKTVQHISVHVLHD